MTLGRTLAFHPSILPLDEPLNPPDDRTRAEMFVLLKSVQHPTGVTTLHVTHSAREPHEPAYGLLVLEDGAVQMPVEVPQAKSASGFSGRRASSRRRRAQRPGACPVAAGKRCKQTKRRGRNRARAIRSVGAAARYCSRIRWASSLYALIT